MKKYLSIIFIALLMIGCIGTSFAADDSADNDEQVRSISNTGNVTLTTTYLDVTRYGYYGKITMRGSTGYLKTIYTRTSTGSHYCTAYVKKLHSGSTLYSEFNDGVIGSSGTVEAGMTYSGIVNNGAYKYNYSAYDYGTTNPNYANSSTLVESYNYTAQW